MNKTTEPQPANDSRDAAEDVRALGESLVIAESLAKLALLRRVAALAPDATDIGVLVTAFRVLSDAGIAAEALARAPSVCS